MKSESDNRSLANAVAEAVSQGIGFLRVARGPEGMWSDFPAAGGSDEWVTAYVGTLLAGTSLPEAIELASKAWHPFALRNFFDGHGGWAFSPAYPGDADSTAWGLRFAISLGYRDTLRMQTAGKFLAQHLTAEGGLATFHADTAFARIGKKFPDYDTTGWTSPHCCVTAAAAVIPSLNGTLLPFLRQQQQDDGGWPAYWTPDSVYTTAWATEALILGGSPDDTFRVGKSLNRILSMFGDNNFIGNSRFPEGSLFATAYGLKVLTTGKTETAGKKSAAVARWLVHHQAQDGSWPSSTLMVIPEPCVRSTENDSYSPVKPDSRSIFTTATVIGALCNIHL